jgi:hypothetical protein
LIHGFDRHNAPEAGNEILIPTLNFDSISKKKPSGMKPFGLFGLPVYGASLRSVSRYLVYPSYGTLVTRLSITVEPLCVFSFDR